MSNLQNVYLKLRNDPDFKIAFQNNPLQALHDAGISLTSKELDMIINQKNESDDGPLDNRINK